MEKQIIIIKPKTLSPKDKEKLTKAGNVVIEHENSSEITFKPYIENTEYTFTNCANCGARIYMPKERLSALRAGKATFYCSHGHGNNYK